jgi:hypothetical protein
VVFVPGDLIKTKPIVMHGLLEDHYSVLFPVIVSCQRRRAEQPMLDTRDKKRVASAFRKRDRAITEDGTMVKTGALVLDLSRQDIALCFVKEQVHAHTNPNPVHQFEEQVAPQS